MRDPWISPHHKDHYNRVDSSTMDHPHLLHGDPHMPIQQFTRGDGKVLLDPLEGKAEELDDYAKLGRKELFLADHDGATGGLNEGIGGDDSDGGVDDEDDEMEIEFGSAAADAIRQHLATYNAKLRSSRGNGSSAFSPLDEVEEKFRTIDRLTSAEGSTQDLALKRRAKTETRDFYRFGTIPKLINRSSDGACEPGQALARDGESGAGDKEFGHGRGFDAESVFGKDAKVQFSYGKSPPSPTHHPDFPEGSFAGDNPLDADEEKWVHELNKLLYNEKYTDMDLGEIDETYTPVNVQKKDMNTYLKEKERTKKYDMLAREDEHEKDREEKPDEILEMIKNNQDPNQEAFGPWYEIFFCLPLQ